MRQKLAALDLVVARTASRQHGVLTFGQLLAAGMSPSGVSRRVAAGRLFRLHRGVYAVGRPDLTREGRWIAAVFACGDGAVLSHRSAAALWAILPEAPPLVDVCVPNHNGRLKRRGICLHYSKTLTANAVTRLRNIPVTSHARTLRDLGFGQEPTRSVLERRFLALCRAHRLPIPEVNAVIGTYRVDFLWRGARLIAETDGYRYHSSRGAFEADRVRDRELARLGFVVLRFTYREVTEEPLSVISSLRAHLQAGPRSGG